MELRLKLYVEKTTRVNSDDIIRRYAKEWNDFTSDWEEDETPEEWDFEEFFQELASKFGWDEVFGNEWNEEVDDSSVWKIA